MPEKVPQRPLIESLGITGARVPSAAGVGDEVDHVTCGGAARGGILAKTRKGGVAGNRTTTCNARGVTEMNGADGAARMVSSRHER